MNRINSPELAEDGPDRSSGNSLPASVGGLPDAGARLSLAGPHFVEFQGRTTHVSASLSVGGVSDDATVASSAQPQRLCHIETIPVELSQAIMREVMKEDLSLDTHTQAYYRAFTQIRLICRRWADILEGMPELWVRLSMRMDERFVDLALSRSMDNPLIITGTLSSSPTLDRLLQHAYRWKVLSVSVADRSTMDHLAVHSAPLLEDLRLYHPIRPPYKILFNGSAPMLRIVHVRGCGVQWSTSLLSNLHSLVLLDIRQGAPDVGVLLEVLSTSPKLTLLRVQNTRLTQSSSRQTRIYLKCLRSLELRFLEQSILKQLADAVDIPMSTNCWFSFMRGTEWQPHSEQLEPINQRLSVLAAASIGSKSALTFWTVSDGCNREARVTYEGGADQQGALIFKFGVFPGTHNDVFEYFARQLGQAEPNPIPSALHIVNCSNRAYERNGLELLQRLHKHLPDTDEILIEDTSSGFIEDVFEIFFPGDNSLQLFRQLSILIIRDSTHKKWAASWLERRQRLQEKQGGWHRLPLRTLKIEGGTISAEIVKGLEQLVPNLVLDHVEVE
ncbi:hypothetical protein FRC01_002027 [Tulasnella sp. 417]|nr:hypothetical protein FRC01_002027 [Tulasnella sp. 417]